MRLKATLSFGIIVLAAMLVIALRPQAGASAEMLLQDVPRLDGISIYFSESNGEASRFDRLDGGISRFAGLLRQLGATLNNLEWRSRIPDDADLIVIAGPMTDLTPEQVARLWSFVGNGGRLLLLANPPAETTGGKALPFATGLFPLLWNDAGMRGRDDVVLTESTSLSATEEAGAAALEAPPLTTSFTTTSLDSAHPITAGLDELTFFITRSIDFDASIQASTTTPLAFTDSSFYGETGYTAYLSDGIIAYESGKDTARGPLALAAAFDDPASGIRVVLIGDRQFITNGAGFQTSPPGSASFVRPGNVRFAINSVTWLLGLGDFGISLPTPGPTSTPSLTPSPTPSPSPTPEVPPTATPGS